MTEEGAVPDAALSAAYTSDSTDYVSFMIMGRTLRNRNATHPDGRGLDGVLRLCE